MKKFFVIAALATFASAANAEESTSGSGSMPEEVAAADGQTVGVSALNSDLTSNEIFSAAFETQILAKAKELNYGTKGTTFETVHFLAGAYRPNNDSKFIFRQYFGYARKTDENNPPTLMDPTLILNQKFNGIWKSEPVSAYFWYYIPVSDPSRQNMSNGKWRVDAEWDWTLSPKWIVGYYVNPRQTLIPDHKVSNTDSATMAEKPSNWPL